MRYVFAGLFILAGMLAAQQYRCDWSVNGIGGGEMSGTSYLCGSTAGQTAAGQMTGTNHQAFIGFWQIDAPVGIQEEVGRPGSGALVTRLFGPAPNPSRGVVKIRYALAAEGPVSLQVHDLTGRTVRTLRASGAKRGAYCVTWNGADDRGRALGNGIYFCRFAAGDYRATEKLVLQR